MHVEREMPGKRQGRRMHRGLGASTNNPFMIIPKTPFPPPQGPHILPKVSHLVHHRVDKADLAGSRHSTEGRTSRQQTQLCLALMEGSVWHRAPISQVDRTNKNRYSASLT